MEIFHYSLLINGNSITSTTVSRIFVFLIDFSVTVILLFYHKLSSNSWIYSIKRSKPCFCTQGRGIFMLLWHEHWKWIQLTLIWCLWCFASLFLHLQVSTHFMPTSQILSLKFATHEYKLIDRWLSQEDRENDKLTPKNWNIKNNKEMMINQSKRNTWINVGLTWHMRNCRGKLWLIFQNIFLPHLFPLLTFPL